MWEWVGSFCIFGLKIVQSGAHPETKFSLKNYWVYYNHIIVLIIDTQIYAPKSILTHVLLYSVSHTVPTYIDSDQCEYGKPNVPKSPKTERSVF